MSRTASLVTMANVKPEEQETSLWQGYSLHTPASNASHHPAYDSNYQPAPLSIPYHGRTQKGTYRSLDIPTLQTRPPPRDESATLTASPPGLNTHHSYPSLKRAFQGGSDMTYMEDFREDMPDIKPSMSQDHRLLMFGRLPDKHTIIDDQGRVKHLDIAAQIHGMFFLSELATPSGESLHTQPELTCYRRNLFQISGNINSPRGPLTFISDRGDRIPIISLDVSVSATESVDGHVVKLIVIPWKTPPPNSPEIPPGQEHEPTPIPLVPFDEGPEANSDFISYPIAYRRLQFRIATANNGRRRELQQHFTLHLNVVGILANGAKVNVCESSTAPIVVRGRSPRNFQTRKEIPLVGSASSRGHPPELHVATNSLHHPSMQRRATMPKPGVLDLPRSPFTFDSATLTGSPSITRQASYPAWSAAHTPMTPDQQTTAPMTPSYPASAISLDSYLQNPPPHSSVLTSPHSQASSANHHNPNQKQGPNSSMTAPPIPNRHQQHQYVYPSSAPPPVPGATSAPPIRFVDHNPRPAKSPRHTIAPPDLPAHGYNDYGTRFAPPYNGGTASGPSSAVSPLLNQRPSEYFPIPPPTTMPGWSASSTAGSEGAGSYGTSNTAGMQSLPPLVMQGGIVGTVGANQQQGQQQQHYEFPSEASSGPGSAGSGYSKEAGSVQSQQPQQSQPHYTWSQS